MVRALLHDLHRLFHPSRQSKATITVGSRLLLIRLSFHKDVDHFMLPLLYYSELELRPPELSLTSLKYVAAGCLLPESHLSSSHDSGVGADVASL